MKVIIFCGPTLERSLVQTALPTAEVRGPAECGDIYEATKRGAKAVGLIDGYFDHRLPVWHKEILWALSRGTLVYGASSMGALRAAELSAFGMVGVGTVFEWFRDGVLEDDDEVAVVHEAADRDHRPRSVALVNLRRTLDEAVRRGVLDDGARHAVLAELKALHYPTRDVPRLLEAVGRVAPGRGAEFAAFVKEHGVVDQKREDALALLRRLRDDLAAPASPPVAFRFQHTNAWQTLVDRFELATAASSGAEGDPDREAAPELPMERALARLARLDSVLYARVVRGALQRALALELAARAEVTLEPLELQAASEELRLERGLFTQEATGEWLRNNGLDVEAFSVLVHDTVLSRALSNQMRAAFLQQVPAILRLLGVYGRVMESA